MEGDIQRVGHSGKQVSDPGELTVYCGQGLHTPLPTALYVFDPHMRGMEVGEHACPGGHLQSDTSLEPNREYGVLAGQGVHVEEPAGA